LKIFHKDTLKHASVAGSLNAQVQLEAAGDTVAQLRGRRTTPEYREFLAEYEKQFKEKKTLVEI
jgi:hypothetical protein